MQKGRDNNKFNQKRCKNANISINKRRRRSKDRRRHSITIPLHNRLNFASPSLHPNGRQLQRSSTNNNVIPTVNGPTQVIQPLQLQQMQQNMQQQLQQQMQQQMQQFDVYMKAAMNTFHQMMMKNQMEFEKKLAALKPPEVCTCYLF